jgi:hypothetical protein
VTIDSRKLEKALKKKGFRLQGGGDHKYYRLYVGDKPTSVLTKVSLGSRYTLSDNLASATKRQLRLDTSAELTDFVSCPLSEERYIALLIDRGKVKL